MFLNCFSTKLRCFCTIFIKIPITIFLPLGPWCIWRALNYSRGLLISPLEKFGSKYVLLPYFTSTSWNLWPQGLFKIKCQNSIFYFREKRVKTCTLHVAHDRMKAYVRGIVPPSKLQPPKSFRPFKSYRKVAKCNERQLCSQVFSPAES